MILGIIEYFISFHLSSSQLFSGPHHGPLLSSDAIWVRCWDVFLWIGSWCHRISTTKMHSWWVYRISEPSTLWQRYHKHYIDVFFILFLDDVKICWFLIFHRGKRWGPLSGAPNKNRWNMERYHAVNGDFLKWWYPTTMGFPTKHDHFGVFCGYHHLGKHPNRRFVFLTNCFSNFIKIGEAFSHPPTILFLRNLTPNWIFDTTKPCLRLPRIRPFLPPEAAKRGEDVSSLLLWGPGPLNRTRWSMEGMVFGSWNA